MQKPALLPPTIYSAFLWFFTPWFFTLWVPSAHAEQNCIPKGQGLPESWFENYEPHRIIGNLYAVGGVDLAVYLLVSDDGHVLINTGMGNSTKLIKDNIAQLGFEIEDVKILLVQQSHFDHAAALAEIKAITGAELWATKPDAPILEAGGRNDPHFGTCLDFQFPPIKVDRLLAQGDLVELGNISLTTHIHAGHTQGSSSYSFSHDENGKSYNVLIANMGSINQGKQLVIDPTYPDVAGDFARTYDAQLKLPVDIWVAAHASQYRRDEKYQPGQSYDPETFVDPQGFRDAVLKLQAQYIKQILDEAR